MSLKRWHVERGASVAPVQFKLGGATVSFPGPGAFERWLECKVAVSGRAWSELLEQENQDLIAETWRDDQLLAQFQRIWARIGAGAAPAGTALGELDLTIVHEDHRWDEILAALGRLPRALEVFQRLGLAYYLGYLECRRDAVLSLIQDRRQGMPYPVRRPAVWEMTALNSGAKAARPAREPPAFARLSQGRPLAVPASWSDSIPLKLGNCEFRLASSAAAVYLSAPGGFRYRLREGRSLVGRGRYNDIVISPEHKTVSRRHLIIEVRDGRVSILTDLSSAGTQVPAALMLAATNAA